MQQLPSPHPAQRHAHRALPDRRLVAQVIRGPVHTAARLRRLLADDAGYTVETVIVTALLAAAALAVIGIIIAKITGYANGIHL